MDNQPKRKRGGQPGNINSVKSKNAHAVLWERRGNTSLRPEDGWVLKLTAEYVRELEEDLGDVTAAQSKVIDLAVTARRCWMLALAAGTPEGLATAHKYMTAELRALQLIGLERKAKAPQSLQEYITNRRPAPAVEAE